MLSFATLVLISTSTFGQEQTAIDQKNSTEVAVQTYSTAEVPTMSTLTKSAPVPSASNPLANERLSKNSNPAPMPAGDADAWQFEIRPYLWLAGIYGRVRIDNLTASTTKDSGSVLGMLDFAAAGQLEAIKGRWRIMLDENYVNLGTTASGPLGIASVEVEPTMNIFEFGGSFMPVVIQNKKATATEPLPPVFTLEILAGIRWFHLGLGLEPANLAPVEGSRNLFGPFIGNRVKVGLRPGLTLIGKYNVGGSGASTNFAWSAEGLLDLRWKKGFSLAGGYRWLDMNTDDPENRVGFAGELKGVIMTFTLYR